MTWVAVGVVVAAFIALGLLLLRDVLRCFALGNVLYERTIAGECHCTRHRICAVCLAELRQERAA
jgi:hypothetical protein